jgi:hypothetical protein
MDGVISGDARPAGSPRPSTERMALLPLPGESVPTRVTGLFPADSRGGDRTRRSAAGA